VHLKIHRALTRRAVEETAAELKKHDMKLIIRGCARVDLHSLLCYRREYHVDRIPFAPHADGWTMGILALQERILKVRKASERGRRRAMLRETGALLHTVQDFFSHTSYAELTHEGRQRFVRALTASEDMPEGVKVCSWGIRSTRGGVRDDFPHRQHARDSGGEEVERGALEASQAYLALLKPLLLNRV
jgi:hypothetical protein